MKLVSLAAVAAAMAVAAPAHAAAFIDIAEVGNNVEFVLSGSLDLTGMTKVTQNPGARSQNGFYIGGFPLVSMGTAGSYHFYSGLTGNPFQVNSGRQASESYGQTFELRGDLGRVAVPGGYVSGTALTARNVFANTTLAALNMVEGSYVYALPQDTLTVRVGPQAVGSVPEPATWAMLVLGFGTIGAGLRARRKAMARIAYA